MMHAHIQHYLLLASRNVSKDRNWNKSITTALLLRETFAASSSLRAIIHASFTRDSQGVNKRALFTLPETIIRSARAFRAGPDVNIYRTKRGYAINTRARQYISFALLHAQSTCCRRHLSRSPPFASPDLLGLLLRPERRRGRKPRSRIAKNPSYLMRVSAASRCRAVWHLDLRAVHSPATTPILGDSNALSESEKDAYESERLIDWCYTVFNRDIPIRYTHPWDGTLFLKTLERDERHLLLQFSDRRIIYLNKHFKFWMFILLLFYKYYNRVTCSFR